MWLRHALKLLLFILILSACSPRDRQAVDKLNSLSYAYHYRNIDSTEVYAQRAYDLSEDYHDGRAEALNNLAFVRIVKMDYEAAKKLLDRLPQTTDNQLELLVGYIQQMRLCQRMSHNRAFYDYREQAIRALGRIEEDYESLSERDRQRLLYAKSELAIVTSTYFYYIGLERESAQALMVIDNEIDRDTAQYLNYQYNMGAGGMITDGTPEDINQTEFDYLMRCFLLAERADYPYFAANSLEALAEHLIDTISARKLLADNLPAMKYLNAHGVDDRELPAQLAYEALHIFSEYGDVYQIAGAYRTLASCYLALEEYPQAIDCLHKALADTTINKAPDLVASIREQMSVAYAAIDDKQQSDLNRNIYLDLQENTRQDRSLEAHAAQLEQSVRQLNILLWAIGGAVFLLIILLVVFVYRYHRRPSKNSDAEWQEREDELKEQLALARLHVENGERLFLEQRAKISMVNTITPFIDRIIHEVGRLDDGNREERLEYIRELTDKINEQNDVLTHWIQLRQGDLNLHVETFPLQQLFDIVDKVKRSFALKGVTLDVQPTQAQVKADRVLTLFMLNTLADNARKFTPEGGKVSISAIDADSYVEISVSDTGKGMDEEQLAHVFEHKISGGHGFGLLNCKGIIEKYRKVSSIFKVCLLSAESKEGQGSRFFFRLPKGVVRLLALGFWLLAFGTQSGEAQSHPTHLKPLEKASIYADSAYFCNVNGHYERTLQFADSCRHYLNEHYRSLRPGSADTLLSIADLSLVSPDIRWYHDSLATNYHTILDIRNESAVAALALHEWPLYYYNNRIYTQLFKEMSADKTLDDYCRKMQQSETNKSIAILILVLFLVCIIFAVLWQVVLSLNKRAKRQQEYQNRLDLMDDDLARIRLEEEKLHVANAVLDNCLSTLKHETMYYPSRIRQLVDTNNIEPLPEVVDYYRELYGILSKQAMRQVEHYKLHLKHLDHEIMGDENLIRYLFDILRKQSGEKTLAVSYSHSDDKYVTCEVSMPQLCLSEEQTASLFTSAGIENIPYLLCRQIVRDHGEATNRRGCAIRAELRDGLTMIIITLPRIWNTSKSLS